MRQQQCAPVLAAAVVVAVAVSVTAAAGHASVAAAPAVAVAAEGAEYRHGSAAALSERQPSDTLAAEAVAVVAAAIAEVVAVGCEVGPAAVGTAGVAKRQVAPVRSQMFQRIQGLGSGMERCFLRTIVAVVVEAW